MEQSCGVVEEVIDSLFVRAVTPEPPPPVHHITAVKEHIPAPEQRACFGLFMI